jgi:hypothetical protein
MLRTAKPALDKLLSLALILDLLQKKYVLDLRICSGLGQTLNYWVDWRLLRLAQPARL